MTTKDFAISKLNALLDTIEALPAVPDLDPSDMDASYEEWEKQFHKLNDLEHDAEIIALCTVPEPVDEMLHRVRCKVQEKQRWHLHGES
jgi:hypothetical protein